MEKPFAYCNGLFDLQHDPDVLQAPDTLTTVIHWQQPAHLQLLSATVMERGELGNSNLLLLAESEQESSARQDPFPIFRVVRPAQLFVPVHEPSPTLPLYEKQLYCWVHDPAPTASRPTLPLLMETPLPTVPQLYLPVQLVAPTFK